MICGKCRREVPDAPYCCQCGAKAGTERTKKKRGNGQGTIYQLPSGHWRCMVTLSSWVDEDVPTLRAMRLPASRPWS